MPLFPAFLKLTGRRCLVVGAGPVAQEKIESLLRAGASVRVVAPHATDSVREWARAKKIRWEPRKFRPADFKGAFLVVASTSSPSLHEKIYRQARRRAILCNVVDDPAHCDFYYGAVVRRGELQIAISTGGHSPALAQRLREKIEREIGAEYEHWLEKLGAARKRLFAKSLSPARRKALLHRLASEISFEKFLRQAQRKQKMNRRK
jgi:precorrin-2 dehydrogenase/sirohydrochlorin ferrochelatase